MDLEDLLTIGGVAIGFFVAVLLYQYVGAWKRLYRFGLILINAFVWAAVTGTVDRLLFHDLPRGTMFYRVFLAIPVIYIGYTLKEYIDQRSTPAPAGQAQQQMQAQEGMVS